MHPRFVSPSPPRRLYKKRASSSPPTRSFSLFLSLSLSSLSRSFLVDLLFVRPHALQCHSNADARSHRRRPCSESRSASETDCTDDGPDDGPDDCRRQTELDVGVQRRGELELWKERDGRRGGRGGGTAAAAAAGGGHAHEGQSFFFTTAAAAKSGGRGRKGETGSVVLEAGREVMEELSAVRGEWISTLRRSVLNGFIAERSKYTLQRQSNGPHTRLHSTVVCSCTYTRRWTVESSLPGSVASLHANR